MPKETRWADEAGALEVRGEPGLLDELTPSHSDEEEWEWQHRRPSGGVTPIFSIWTRP